MIIEKNDKRIQDIKDYKLIVNTEKHANHIIEIDEHGTIRWKEDNNLRSLLDIGKLDINNITTLFYALGYDKNSEVYRDFYRKLGYSLSGYWEIFYWEVNNEEARQYKPPVVRHKKFNIPKLNMFDIQIFWWTWQYEMFYSKCFVDSWVHNLNFGLFSISWI